MVICQISWRNHLQIKLNAFSLWEIENSLKMADNHNYGKKGGCVGRGALYLALFIIMLIWIYWKNQNGIPE